MEKLSVILLFLFFLCGCKKDEIVTISVDKNEIQADGIDRATFTVKSDDNVVNDALIYFAGSNTLLDSYSFSTEEPGEYAFYAIRNEFKSENIKVKAIEVIIQDTIVIDTIDVVDTLSLNVTLNADIMNLFVGDTATFNVICNEEDVTSLSEIYNAVDSTKLSSNEFSTVVPGTYTFYAMYDDVKSQVFTSHFRLPHFTNTDGAVWYNQSWAATLYPVAGYGSR